MENSENREVEEIRAPLILTDKEDGHGDEEKAEKSTKEDIWMVYLSTFVAVCGSYEFGCCVSDRLPFFLVFDITR